MTESTLFRKEVSEYRKTRLHGEVVLSQPLSTKLMVGVLFSSIAIVGTWLSIGTYARIETVPGILVTAAPAAKIIPLGSGIVAELSAQEGQLVKRGEQLVVIDLDRRAVSGAQVVSSSLNTLETRRRLTHQQFEIAQQRALTERKRLHSAIENADQQASSLRQQISLQEEIVASNQQLFDQISKVVERGFVSKVDYERRRQTLINSQQQLAGLRQQLSAKVAEAEQARSQLRGIAIETTQDAIEIKTLIQSIAQQQAQQEGEQGYVITAPISGRITALQTAKGRTVNSNLPLMVIVPDGSELQAELYAPTRAIGFVKKGQEARLLFDAFPYQRFGSFGGKVINVSRTTLDPREVEAPIKLEEGVYRIIVSLDRQEISALGDRIELQPGMTLRANIVLERQSFFSWLLRPFNAVMRRST